MRILCIRGTSRYASLDGFLDAIGAGFAAGGHEVTTIHVHDALRAPAPPPVDMVFSFGGVGAGLTWGVPIVTWLVDSPVFTPRLEALSPERDAVLVVAGEHIGMLQSFLGIEVPAGFVPHGAAPGLRAVGPDPDADRPIDVLFVGSYDRLPDPEWSSADPRIRGTIERVFALGDERWDRHMRELDVSHLFLEGAHHNSLPTGPAAHWEIAPLLAWLDQDLRF
jgi:hypothetical protein